MSNPDSASHTESRPIEKLTHGNYHTWAPRATARLMELGVWRFCTDEEVVPPKPTQPVRTPGATQTKIASQNREYKEDQRHYSECLRRNDKAIGTISNLIEVDQLAHIEGKTTAKEVWDALKKEHADTHTGLAAFYTKVGMLSKKYTEGENMHTHLSFLTTENRKLGTKAFDDEFLAQVMLMSLPRDSTWETLVVALLQSTNEQAPLTSTNVTSRLMQEYRRLTGTEASDSALLTSRNNKSKSSKSSDKKKKICDYCHYTGHTTDECRRKKRDEEKSNKDGDKGRTKDKKKASANVANTSDSDSGDDEQAHLASILAEFPSHSKQWENDDSIHVFIASDVVAYLAKSSHNETYIDSGCTRHLSPRRDWFNDATYKPLDKPISIHLGDASVIKAIGTGSLQYMMDTPNAAIPGTIPDALYVPELAASLLSVSRFTDRKHALLFKEDNCFVYTSNNRCVAAAIKTSGGLYRLLARPMLSKEYANIAHTSRNIDINTLHRRLGHLGHDNVKRLVAKGMVEGVESVGGRIDFCEPCIHGKQHRFAFPPSQKRARRKLDLVHSDVCGPLPFSIRGMRYFITFIDDHTRKLWLYPIRLKSDAFKKFREFKALVELQTGLRIKVIRTDGGGEYISFEFETYLVNCGIIHEKTAPHSPEQNGLAEIINRIVVERFRCMLFEANLSTGFWAEAALTATYLINRCPVSRLLDMTPEEAWSGIKPITTAFRPFGCPAYAHVPKANRTKLESKT